jgi:hypothetical protein
MLRHYPSDWDMNRAAEGAPEVFQERMEDLHRFVAAGSREAGFRAAGRGSQVTDFGPLAHAWLEQWTHNPLVRSSTLRGPTKQQCKQHSSP